MKLLFTFCLLLLSAISSAQINLVTSIKPLTLIAKEIGGDHLVIHQLIPDNASHHDYPMKMSDHRLLDKADVVVWIGPEMESFLTRPLANLPKEKSILLMAIPGLIWPGETHHIKPGHIEPGHRESEDEHHHSQDPHLWLNPQNVVLIVKELTKKLSALDKKNASDYQKNADQFIASLTKLDEEIAEEMSPLSDKGFAVYHHGYNHFVDHYHLKQLGYLSLTPERKSGAKHLNVLFNALDKEGKCIFGEPMANNSQLLAIAKQHQLKVGYLDLMGINANSYQQLMQSLADNLLACLSDGSR